MKKIVLSGSTGLIGSYCRDLLHQTNQEVVFLTRDNCDIFDEKSIREFFVNKNITHFIHLAWDTSKGYLNSEINFEYKNASLNLLKYFYDNGGKKALIAGTCFEYDFCDIPLKETDRLNPKSSYARAKVELLEQIHNKYSEFIWTRIFYTFGYNEHPFRFVPYLISSLSNNKQVTINSSYLIRDYLYAYDVARAIVNLINSDCSGVFNICSGSGSALGELAKIIAHKLCKKEYLILKNNPAKEAKFIVGDNTKLLNHADFNPVSLDDAIDDVLYKINVRELS